MTKLWIWKSFAYRKSDIWLLLWQMVNTILQGISESNPSHHANHVSHTCTNGFHCFMHTSYIHVHVHVHCTHKCSVYPYILYHSKGRITELRINGKNEQKKWIFVYDIQFTRKSITIDAHKWIFHLKFLVPDRNASECTGPRKFAQINKVSLTF